MIFFLFFSWVAYICEYYTQTFGLYTINDIFFFLLMYVNGTQVRIPPTTDQHIKTALHQDRLKISTSKNQQLFLNGMTNSNSKGDFKQELTNAMLSADILFLKIENVCFNSFLRKWTGENIPSESTLRKLHLKKCY